MASGAITLQQASDGAVVYQLDESGSKLIYYPAFLAASEAQTFYQTLLREIPWHNQNDEWQENPRQVCWFSDDAGTGLSYATVNLRSRAWTESSLTLRNRVLNVPAIAEYVSLKLTGH
jgi:hypothetical protein